MLLEVARMYCKFVLNSNEQCVFKNIFFVQVSTVCNIMIHNKQEPIGLVFHDRQNGSTIKDFSVKYFMWLYLR